MDRSPSWGFIYQRRRKMQGCKRRSEGQYAFHSLWTLEGETWLEMWLFNKENKLVLVWTFLTHGLMSAVLFTLKDILEPVVLYSIKKYFHISIYTCTEVQNVCTLSISAFGVFFSHSFLILSSYISISLCQSKQVSNFLIRLHVYSFTPLPHWFTIQQWVISTRTGHIPLTVKVEILSRETTLLVCEQNDSKRSTFQL